MVACVPKRHLNPAGPRTSAVRHSVDPPWERRMSSAAELPGSAEEPSRTGESPAADGAAATIEIGADGLLGASGQLADQEDDGQSAERPYPGGIPEATVARLPVYLRALYTLADRGVATVASDELAAAAGVNSAKLRKDLSHLGSYGIRGVGYDVEYLVYQVSRALGLTQSWSVVSSAPVTSAAPWSTMAASSPGAFAYQPSWTATPPWWDARSVRRPC